MTNTCAIKFERMDFLPSDMNYFQRKAWKIASLIKFDPKLLEVLSDFLLIFIDKQDFSKRFKKWKGKLELISCSYNKETLENLIDELEDSFNKIKDNKSHLDKFRGLIFEYIIENYYKEKYREFEFSSGCKVVVNGNPIKYICKDDETKNRNTVDVAGYSKQKSEFYEAKVGPNGFDNHVIKYLNLLNNTLMMNEVSDTIVVGCMTLEKKAKLNIKLRSLEENYTNLSVFGVKEILDILKN